MLALLGKQVIRPSSDFAEQEALSRGMKRYDWGPMIEMDIGEPYVGKWAAPTHPIKHRVGGRRPLAHCCLIYSVNRMSYTEM